MSNFRRMLMMLAQDLPKRESICGVEEYGSEVVTQEKMYYSAYSKNITDYKTASSSNCGYTEVKNAISCKIHNVISTANQISLILFDKDGNISSTIVRGENNPCDHIADIDDSVGYIGFNSTIAGLSVFSLQVTYCLSQDAYDYALSFGKKVVKDLKKVIEQSENPALLIKRINDWKYLIHSLVDTGYTSWLKGDGSAYMKIAKTYSTTSRMEVMYSSDTTLKNRYICGWDGGEGTPMLFLCINNATPSRYQVGFGKAFSNTTKVLDDKIHSCVIDKGAVYFDNIENYRFTGYTEGNASTFYVFGGARTTTNGTKCNIAKVIVENTLYVVPYHNGSEYCMLDINSGEIYENANVVDGAKVGEFSLSVTDAKGNEYEDFCDVEGNRIVTTLNDGDILCWNQLANYGSISIGRASYTKISEREYNFIRNSSLKNSGQCFFGLEDEFTNGDYIYFGCYSRINSVISGKFGFAFLKGAISSEVKSNNVDWKSVDKYERYEWISKSPYNGSAIINGIFCGAKGGDVNEQNFDIKDCMCIDASMLFKHIPSLDLSILNLNSVVYSEGNDVLGYTPYTSTSIPLIVLHGTLHYAINKSVRDYAEEKGKLDALNAYCCENKDKIAIFNADKTKVDTLLS